MAVYLFRSSRDEKLFGFTSHESGSNLPEEFAPWVDAGSVETATGMVALVMEAISRDGYYLQRVVLLDPERTKRPLVEEGC
jgi:hypothetical protein